MKSLKLTLALVALCSLASCAHKEEQLDPSLHGFFPDDVGEARKPAQFADLMAASGARADAMLYKQHFDGGRLNSLGEEKLAYMLRDDDAPAPMTVYLKLDETSALAKSREASVVTFLRDKGLEADQIKVLYGDNPESRSAAAAHIAGMSKAQTGESGSGGSGGDAKGGGGGGAAAAGGGGSTDTGAK